MSTVLRTRGTPRILDLRTAPKGPKYAHLRRQIAADLLLREPGQQLPTVSEFASRFEVGSGTVHQVLRGLESAGAVRLEARGHKGTYVLEKDFRLLWEAAGSGVLLGGLPLPRSRRIQALATTLENSFRRSRIPFDVAYLDGSRKRLGHLRLGKLDLAVVSRLAARRAWDNRRDVVVAASLGPGTYRDVGDLRLLEADRPLRRIGVDRRSCDHYWRTVTHFPDQEERLVHVPYSRIPDAVARGEIDAALWYVEGPWAGEIPPTVQLREVEPCPLDEWLSEACLVALRTNRFMVQLLERQFDAETVMSVRALAGSTQPACASPSESEG